MDTLCQDVLNYIVELLHPLDRIALTLVKTDWYKYYSTNHQGYYEYRDEEAEKHFLFNLSYSYPTLPIRMVSGSAGDPSPLQLWVIASKKLWLWSSYLLTPKENTLHKILKYCGSIDILADIMLYSVYYHRMDILEYVIKNYFDKLQSFIGWIFLFAIYIDVGENYVKEYTLLSKYVDMLKTYFLFHSWSTFEMKSKIQFNGQLRLLNLHLYTIISPKDIRYNLPKHKHDIIKKLVK